MKITAGVVPTSFCHHAQKQNHGALMWKGIKATPRRFHGKQKLLSFFLIKEGFFMIYTHRLEKEMAPNSSTLDWKIPRMEEPGRLQSMGSRRVTTERLHFYFSLSCTGEGNGNPLQCSCLENPGDGGAWWAAVFGVAQSRTWLKRLSSSSRKGFGLPLWLRR